MFKISSSGWIDGVAFTQSDAGQGAIIRTKSGHEFVDERLDGPAVVRIVVTDELANLGHWGNSPGRQYHEELAVAGHLAHDGLKNVAG
jgi:hypothetical protein